VPIFYYKKTTLFRWLHNTTYYRSTAYVADISRYITSTRSIHFPHSEAFIGRIGFINSLLYNSVVDFLSKLAAFFLSKYFGFSRTSMVLCILYGFGSWSSLYSWSLKYTLLSRQLACTLMQTVSTYVVLKLVIANSAKFMCSWFQPISIETGIVIMNVLNFLFTW